MTDEEGSCLHCLSKTCNGECPESEPDEESENDVDYIAEYYHDALNGYDTEGSAF
jgi:hypothetical protein